MSQLASAINLLSVKIGIYWASFATFATAAITDPSTLVHAVAVAVGAPEYVSIFDVVYWGSISGSDMARLVGLLGVTVMSMKGITDIIDWWKKRSK